MEDREIIALYHRRDEGAIRETDAKYGRLCRRVAMNILSIPEDVQECVNDTYHAAWRRMPPDVPASLGAFLGRLTRNIAIDRFRANRAQKRYHGMEIMLSELEDCIPAGEDPERAVEGKELSVLLSHWLDSLPREERVMFIRRYWYGDGVKELAAACGRRPEQLSQKLFRLRKRLKDFLEAEGVFL